MVAFYLAVLVSAALSVIGALEVIAVTRSSRARRLRDVPKNDIACLCLWFVVSFCGAQALGWSISELALAAYGISGA